MEYVVVFRVQWRGLSPPPCCTLGILVSAVCYSHFCRLYTTLVKAISVVATGLGCPVDIVKVTRCSKGEAVMADQISKAEFHGCFETGRRMGGDP